MATSSWEPARQKAEDKDIKDTKDFKDEESSSRGFFVSLTSLVSLTSFAFLEQTRGEVAVPHREDAVPRGEVGFPGGSGQSLEGKALAKGYDDRLTYRCHAASRSSRVRPRASREGRSMGSSASRGTSTSGCSREKSLASSINPLRSRSPAQQRSSQPLGRQGSAAGSGAPSITKRGWTRFTTTGPRW